MAQGNARRQVHRLSPERRIADIMAAAKAVFTEKGYQEALISDIAERAGVVEGSIYRYFTNKRDLLVRVTEHWYEEMLVRDAEQFAGVRGSWNQIRFIVHHHLMTIRREPALSRIVFQELRPDPDYRSTRLFQLNQTYTHRVIDVIKEAVANGEFRSNVSPALIRDMIYGCIEHRTWAFLRNEGDFDAEETADSITDIVYRGLAIDERTEEPMAGVVSRLENVAARLEGMVGKGRGR
ncbi:TetR/AcrR family transcriptional regulator [Bradyrhizobium jicamae]|uniref:TetR/AcrR family transcriptional regulator n=1 Tax=Bradyrhizobium jicamae TaxID=280332 RepID=UPI001BA767B4|nr:TetR/AcrR family transcriptional regulator [Bradyrhizobium jicamae]MBR0756253.1 TetR/AcrR family transcriptional regulator [Bradyrhizobium jicamae]